MTCGRPSRRSAPDLPVLVTSVVADASRVARSARPDAYPGVVKHRPSVVHVPGRCLPPAFPPASARCCHTPCMFRPRGLSPPRRASSSETLAGLLHPAPDPGVHRVSARAVAPACGLPHTSLGLVPPLRCSPSSAFPACAAEPASPPAPTPSPLLRHACRPDLEALLRTRVRGTTAALPRRCARCAHGLPFLELPRSEAVASSRGPMPCLRRPARRSPFGSLPSACRLSATSPHPRGCILP
jgi:hypothetical protein